MPEPAHELPPDPPIRLVPRHRFSDHTLGEFVKAVVEWTREHHPERLTGPHESGRREKGE
jgi:hypothetical protein